MSTTPDAGESVGLEVTETAASKAQTLLAAEGLEDDDAGLRLLAREKGCDCGDVAYGLELAGDVESTDVVVEEHGLRVVIDEASREFVEDVRLDYVDDFRGEGFTLERTVAHEDEGGCGCGGHHH